MESLWAESCQAASNVWPRWYYAVRSVVLDWWISAKVCTYQLWRREEKLGLLSSMEIRRGPFEASTWHWCKKISQLVARLISIRLMLEIFPGEALNLYLKSSWSHCSFLGHKRQSKGCQAAGLLPSWPHFTMSVPLWKACPRQCTRDAQPSHPSMGVLLFFP